MVACRETAVLPEVFAVVETENKRKKTMSDIFDIAKRKAKSTCVGDYGDYS